MNTGSEPVIRGGRCFWCDALAPQGIDFCLECGARMIKEQQMTGLPRDDKDAPKATRAEAYAAIDTERDYQDSFVIPERRYYATHTVGEFVVMLNQYALQCQQKWTHHADVQDGFPESLHEMRKLAAVAVRCMEQHGAIHRVGQVVDLGSPGFGFPHRQSVYLAIDTERSYQDSMWPADGSANYTQNPLTLGEFIALANEYAARTRTAWSTDKKDCLETLRFVRKVAGICVNCMEQHGAPRRLNPKAPPGPPSPPVVPGHKPVA